LVEKGKGRTGPVWQGQEKRMKIQGKRDDMTKGLCVFMSFMTWEFNKIMCGAIKTRE